jgi:catechol 2,3-dioxygenase-like lactoylglutathione lyase family enzyme
MLKTLTHINVWVHDQDDALAFYTEKVGMEMRDDVTMPELGGFRWLTVGLPGQDVALALMAVPGPPVFDQETSDQIKALMAKGAAGGLFFSTTTSRAPTKSSRSAESSSSRSRRSSRTASTTAAATPRATRLGCCRRGSATRGGQDRFTARNGGNGASGPTQREEPS